MTTIVEHEVHSANDDGGASFTNEKALEKKELETTSATAAPDSELCLHTPSVNANNENFAYSETAVAKKPEQENDAEMRQSEDVASSFPEKVRSVPSWWRCQFL
jgi:hypothetical protein